MCAEVEELRSQVNRLQSRNRELELQSSGRNSDHARQIRQVPETRSKSLPLSCGKNPFFSPVLKYYQTSEVIFHEHIWTFYIIYHTAVQKSLFIWLECVHVFVLDDFAQNWIRAKSGLNCQLIILYISIYQASSHTHIHTS